MAEHHIDVRRTARYYTLGHLDGGARITDLWVVCHGYGQLAGEFAESFRVVAAPSRLIAAPEALSRFYLDRTPAPPGSAPPRVGATWMTREDRESEIGDQVAYLDALHDRLREMLPDAGVRLHVLGFSQGVATVGRWLARGRARADRMILWAGSYPPDVDLAAVAPRFAQCDVVLVVGSRDTLTSWTDANGQLQRFEDAGIAARLISFDGGHRLDDATLIALADQDAGR